MDKNLLVQRIESYRFFSYMFFTLPNTDFVNKMLTLYRDDEQLDEGSSLLKQYVMQNKDADREKLALDLAVDKTRLFHGLTQQGPRPPFESLYLSLLPQEAIGSLNRAYAAEGLSLDTDCNEPSDYIGVEIIFLQYLCEQELEAIEDDDFEQSAAWFAKQAEFFNTHLGLWATELAEEILKFAQTDFYRAIALMLRDFVTEEAQRFEPGS